MLLDLGILIVGLVGLFFGGEWLVRSASRLATAFGIPTLVIGLTVVALGTSAPELVVSLSAAASGSSEIALGNVIGSNIANMGLILGTAGLIAPLLVNSSLIRKEMPFMILASLLTFGFALDGEIAQLEGAVLLGGYFVFTYLLYRSATKANNNDEVLAEVSAIEGQPPPVNRLRESLSLLAGLITLIVGAQFTVNGAVGIARGFGISELVIGLTLVAVGTSLPELVTSVIATLRGHDDLTAGNVVGSNIANLLIILGLTAILRPIPVAAPLLRLEFPLMIAFSAIAVILMFNRRLSRWQAGLLLAGYLAFIMVTVI